MNVRYAPDQPILNWLYAGPFMLDVSDRYTDNYIVPYEVYDDLWQEGAALLGSVQSPRESDACSLCGLDMAWRLVSVHEADTRLTWAEFCVTASLLATLVYTSVYVEQAGSYTLKLQGTGGFRLLVNGECAAESCEVGRVDYQRTAEVTLKQGWNAISALLFNVHLHCQNVLRLSVNAPSMARTELIGIPEETRKQVEQAFWRFSLSDTLLLKDMEISLCWDVLPGQGKFEYKLLSPGGGVLNKGILPADARMLPLPAYDALPADGVYTVGLAYVLEDKRVEGIPRHFRRFSMFPEVPADASDTMTHRKAYLLNTYATMKDVDYHACFNVFVEIAKMASGHEELFDEAALRATLDYINLRYDCADFALHGVLRFYILYGKRLCIRDDLRQAMKECILNFKYWVDEPGRSLMFTRSENHEMLFFTAEYIAGSLFPTELFTNSGQNGLFHALKGRMLAVSKYQPPAMVVEMQKAPQLETHTRMGLFRSEGQQGVHCSTYRTEHYMVSGMIESKAGEHGSQVNAGEALLEDSVPIFATCFANRSPNTRPSYFGGQHVIPKTITYRSVLAYIYHIEQETGYTHCFFPQPEMDEVLQAGQLVFGRKGKAYVGLYCNQPYTVTEGGMYHQRELLSMHKDVFWLLELGDADEYGSFEAFTAAVSGAALESSEGGVCYTSPRHGEMFFHYTQCCTVNGKPVYEKNLPMIRNPYAYSEYGSGKIEMCDGRVIDFFA